MGERTGNTPPEGIQRVTQEVRRYSQTELSPRCVSQQLYFWRMFYYLLFRENGSEVLFKQVENAETISIPRSVVDGDTTFQLTVTAHNHFGTSESHPYIFSVKDIGRLTFLLSSPKSWVICELLPLFCHCGLTNLTYLSSNCFSVSVIFLSKKLSAHTWHCFRHYLQLQLRRFESLPESKQPFLSYSKTLHNLMYATFMYSCFPVIPETPHIIQLQFENNSKTALLQWNTTEFSRHLAPFVRLRTDNGPWVSASAMS